MQEKPMKKTSNNYISNNINDTFDFSSMFAKKLKPSDIVCLIGDLGVGKTVIAKGIAKYFNVDTDVISPTFNILKIYDVKNSIIKRIYHYDLYRLKSINELYNIGFDEYISDSNAIHIIEWPEIAKELLPKNHYKVSIEYDKYSPDKRIIKYE